MSKYNCKVDSKELERIRKQSEKVNKIMDQVEKLKEQLKQIQDNERWLRYTTSESVETLTQEENWELNDLVEKIMDSKI